MKKQWFSKLVSSLVAAAALVATLNASAQTAAPVILTQPANSAGLKTSQAQFVVVASNTPVTYQWYYTRTTNTATAYASTNITAVVNSAKISGATNSTLVITNLQTTDVTNFFVTVSNILGSTNSSVVSLTSVTTTLISTQPASVNGAIAGSSTISVTAFTNSGSTTSYQWYYSSTSSLTNAGNLTSIVANGTSPDGSVISGATTASLKISNLQPTSGTNFFVAVTNGTVGSNSAVAKLTVLPLISAQPVSAYGLLGGQVQFNVLTPGTTTYQWNYSDTNGNIIAPVVNGTTGSGSIISGATSSNLVIRNIQMTDPTNFVVMVANGGNSAQSAVASLLAVTNHAVLALWDFNGVEFSNSFPNATSVSSPRTYLGVGRASTVSSSASSLTTGVLFGTTADVGGDGPGFGPSLGAHSPYYSWQTSGYPSNSANKLNGVQFNVSTVGAQNILITYDSRVSATASDYERLQYTTNGTTWVDYPSSSSFNGVALTAWNTFNYNLTGFPGVDNNPNFGVRVVTELATTALYGNSPSNIYIGAQNDYGTTGTVSYDLVTISADAITNTALPPVISSIANLTITDSAPPVTVNFTVSDGSTSPDSLNYSATSLTSYVAPSFSFGGSGNARTLTISPNGAPDQSDTGPILITVTDPNTGQSAVTSFLLTVNSVNFAPTNSLVAVSLTNTLVNTPITIPFTVSDDRTPPAGLTYKVSSYNNTLLPVGNIVITGQGTANPSVTITPATNQIGTGQFSVTVSDNDAVVARSATAFVAVNVRPNTNVLFIDYFNYDNQGPLEITGSNFWNHLTGNFNQLANSTNDAHLQGSGYVVLDGASGFTDNLFAPFIGGQISTNSSTVLYMSFIANLDPAGLPIGNGGSYFILFQDGTFRNTPNVNCRVVVTTNNAAPGFYRLAIANNNSSVYTNAVQFPQDLVPGTNYVVVASEVVSNGISRLWVNPSSASSQSVMDTNPATAGNLFNPAGVFLRESGGAAAGRMRVAKLKVGTTFDAALPSLVISNAAGNVVVSSSDPTLGIQAATNVAGPYTNVSAFTPYTNTTPAASDAIFYRFSR